MADPAVERAFNIFPVDYPSIGHAGMSFPEVRGAYLFFFL